MKKVLSSMLICLLTLSFNVKSSETIPFDQVDLKKVNTTTLSDNEKDYFTIESIEIKKIEDNWVETRSPIINKDATDVSISGNGSSLGQIILMVDKLIALGKKMWGIVIAGRPVVTASFNPISVLPRLQDPTIAFLEMGNWSLPLVQKYEVVYKNVYGMEVVHFSFMVIAQHSGTYQNTGKYLTGVNIVPMDISVAWGYKFDAKSELMAISNVGNSDNPIAAATLQLNYTTSTPIKESRASILFHVVGDGRILQL